MKVVNNISSLLERRRLLRNNPTKEEVILWSRLKNSQIGFKFRRQHSIGGYIVDFYCPQQRLVVEIDGPNHSTKPSIELDKIRTDYFNGLDIRVIRFTNFEVSTEIEMVLNKIKSELTTP